MRIAALAGLFATPLFGYPIAATALFGVDSLAGERIVIFHLLHEKRLLLNAFTADWVASLPSAYLVSTVLVFVALGVRRLRDDRAGAVALTVGCALAGLGAATSFTGAWIGATHVALLAAGVAYSVPLRFCVRRLSSSDVV